MKLLTYLYVHLLSILRISKPTINQFRLIIYDELLVTLTETTHQRHVVVGCDI